MADNNDIIDIQHNITRHEDDLTRMAADVSAAAKEIATIKDAIKHMASALNALDRIVVNSHTNMLQDTPEKIKLWQKHLKEFSSILKTEDAA